MKKATQGEVKFPKWISEDVAQSYKQNRDREIQLTQIPEGAPEDYRKLREQEIAVLLERQISPHLLRLCTSDEMRKCWEFLAAHAIGDVPHTSLFFSAAICGLIGPYGEARLTPKQFEERRCEIQQTAKRLASLVRGTSLDGYLRWRKRAESFQWYTRRGLSAALRGHKIPPEIEVLALNLQTWESLPDVLDEFAGRVPSLLTRPQAARPNNAAAPRNYFANVLTEYFVEHFGKPHRDFVVSATVAAFEDKGFSPRKLQAVAKVKR